VDTSTATSDSQIIDIDITVDPELYSIRARVLPGTVVASSSPRIGRLLLELRLPTAGDLNY
jgi:hypothetical protein